MFVYFPPQTIYSFCFDFSDNAVYASPCRAGAENLKKRLYDVTWHWPNDTATYGVAFLVMTKNAFVPFERVFSVNTYDFQQSHEGVSNVSERVCEQSECREASVGKTSSAEQMSRVNDGAPFQSAVICAQWALIGYGFKKKSFDRTHYDFFSFVCNCYKNTTLA